MSAQSEETQTREDNDEAGIQPQAPARLEVGAPVVVPRQRRYAVKTESGWVEMADEGKVRIPVAGLVGTVIGILVSYFMFRFWETNMDGLIVDMKDFGKSVGPMAVLMLMAGAGSLLMHRASRQPGAHESRALITWGLLLNWLPIVLFGLALFGTLLAAMGISDGSSMVVTRHDSSILDLGTSSH